MAIAYPTDEIGRAVYHTIYAFLFDRLSEPAIIDWALEIPSSDRAARAAVLEVVDRNRDRLGEPFASAWSLVEEAWSNEPTIKDQMREHLIERRLKTGDRSGAVIQEIVQFVAPRLEVERLGERLGVEKPRKLNKPSHLLYPKMTSGRLRNRPRIIPASIDEVHFLEELVVALEGALNAGLSLARRLGWNDETQLWPLGGLRKVYYLDFNRDERDQEIDEYRQGIAPCVKLLHAVVQRVSQVNIDGARAIVRRWRYFGDPIHRRLWASFARDETIASADEVGEFLLELDPFTFWAMGENAEITELRNKRFDGLSGAHRSQIITRLSRPPPRNLWPRKADNQRVEDSRIDRWYREISALPAVIEAVSPSNRVRFQPFLQHQPEKAVSRQEIDEFRSGFDTLTSAQRVQALELAITSTDARYPRREVWARDWVTNNILFVLSDLEAIADVVFPNVLDKFCSAHRPQHDAAHDEMQNQADRVIGLLQARVSDDILRASVSGASLWLDNWSAYCKTNPEARKVWMRLWPMAVSATNALRPTEQTPELTVIASNTEDADDEHNNRLDFDTLNTPAGELVGFFLSSCPHLGENPKPFRKGTPLRKMRDALMAADGRSRLIVQQRLVDALDYFIKADEKWARSFLVTPLHQDSDEARDLWRAIGRRTLFDDTLSVIGDEVARRASDRQLGRETRQSLAFSVVVEMLHAFQDGREPVIPRIRATQMLRVVDDVVRAFAASAVELFVRDVSHNKRPPPSPEDVYRKAAKPFLESLWPQELYLVTPGVSEQLATLPRASGDSFVDAVNTIERFLVPFDCWSLHALGLPGSDQDIASNTTAKIDKPDKARAALILLNATIGTREGAVVPYDLAFILDIITRIDPSVSDLKTYKRLAALTRR